MASDSALKLAGLIMAHAFWIISDLDEGGFYVPQALCEKGTERKLNVFAAETQVEAVERAKAFLTDNMANYDRVAFAREGHVQGSNGYVDVLIIDIVEGSIPPSLTIVQPYRKSGLVNLALLGDEVLLTDSGDRVAAADVVASLRNGAAEHEKARRTWEELNSKRAEAVDPFR